MQDIGFNVHLGLLNPLEIYSFQPRAKKISDTTSRNLLRFHVGGEFRLTGYCGLY